jgi:hypothetical protein
MLSLAGDRQLDHASEMIATGSHNRVDLTLAEFKRRELAKVACLHANSVRQGEIHERLTPELQMVAMNSRCLEIDTRDLDVDEDLLQRLLEAVGNQSRSALRVKPNRLGTR